MASLRRASGRAARAGTTNLLYVRAAVEAPPPELAGVADRITAILPWGSLLATLVRPVVPMLRNVRSMCQPGASLTVVFSLDPDRDRGEARRLELPKFGLKHFDARLADGYAAAGFAVTSIRAVPAVDLGRWPSGWARRLAFGRPRPVFQLEARCREASAYWRR